MFDVVVFPQKGKRPHPSELSGISLIFLYSVLPYLCFNPSRQFVSDSSIFLGSDLDGDEYFVCWSDSLHPQIKNKDPGDYEAAKTQLEPNPITPVQLTNQVVKHITKPNNLGQCDPSGGVNV